LIYSPGLAGKQIGVRKTLSDIAVTAAAFFKTEAPQHGVSFLEDLRLPH
jgi:phosphopentomutase